MTNTYSTTWFETFLEPISRTQTEAEVAFVARNLPNPPFRMLLDLCCGEGRHSELLAEAGYEVTGVDFSDYALGKAKASSDGRASYLKMDMRELEKLPGSFDAVISLWQSFGYFDEAQNADVLRQITAKLKPLGRLILDIYHRAFFEQRQGVMSYEREGRQVTSASSMGGNRLTVRLEYGPGEEIDIFDWQLYTPDEITALAETLGLMRLVACTGFDDATPPSPESPRMQLVFQKLGDAA
ncbi:MAG: methyltransferase domain-containing protein [Chloroflexi bacterium]|nr:methyltransferase domain-containing protein [Chloroflexota bacterium]